MFVVVQAAALLICYEYELPLQQRLRRLLVLQREVTHAAPQRDVVTSALRLPR